MREAREEALPANTGKNKIDASQINEKELSIRGKELDYGYQ